MVKENWKNATGLIVALVTLGSGGIWIGSPSAAKERVDSDPASSPAPPASGSPAGQDDQKSTTRREARKATRLPQTSDAQQRKSRDARELVKKRIRFAV